VSRVRLNVFLERDHANRLDELATMKRMSKSGIVAAALASYLSPEGADRREVLTVRRLGQLSHQFERLERDQAILIETVALFVRHQLAVTAPIPEAHQDAARAQGRARFEQFIEQLARHLARGHSLVRDVFHEIAPTDGRGEGARSNGAGQPAENAS
jgi:hypothetical protein